MLLHVPFFEKQVYFKVNRMKKHCSVKEFDIA